MKNQDENGSPGFGEKEEQLNQTKTNPLKMLGTKELTNTAIYN